MKQIVDISEMSIPFTFWNLRRFWYCLKKYPPFASVKILSPPPNPWFITIVFFHLFLVQTCWTVLSMSSIRHQHPLRTLMQISNTYAHAQGTKASQRPKYCICSLRYTCAFLCVFGYGIAFVLVQMHICDSRYTLFTN